MKITVACDGSVQSEQALRLAARLPLNNPEFHLVSVAPEVYCDPESIISRDTAEKITEFNQQLEEKASKALKSAEVILKEGDISSKTFYLKGDPAEKLTELSSDSGLMVCGSRGLNPVESFFLGSISDTLVRHSHCPVLLFRGDNQLPPTGQGLSLCIGFDDSDSSKKACDFLKMIDLKKIKTVDLVSVLQTSFHYGMSYSLTAQDTWPAYRKSLEERMTETAKKLFGSQAKSPRVNIEIVTDANDTADALSQHAHRRKSSLLVAGSRGKSLMDRLIIGSTSNRLAHHSRVPLLIVRDEKDSKK